MSWIYRRRRRSTGRGRRAAPLRPRRSRRRSNRRRSRTRPPCWTPSSSSAAGSRRVPRPARSVQRRRFTRFLLDLIDKEKPNKAKSVGVLTLTVKATQDPLTLHFTWRNPAKPRTEPVTCLLLTCRRGSLWKKKNVLFISSPLLLRTSFLRVCLPFGSDATGFCFDFVWFFLDSTGRTDWRCPRV